MDPIFKMDSALETLRRMPLDELPDDISEIIIRTNDKINTKDDSRKFIAFAIKWKAQNDEIEKEMIGWNNI